MAPVCPIFQVGGDLAPCFSGNIPSSPEQMPVPASSAPKGQKSSKKHGQVLIRIFQEISYSDAEKGTGQDLTLLSFSRVGVVLSPDGPLHTGLDARR